MANKETSKTVKIGLTAGVIGAAAGAAGVLLSDKKNRKKVATKLDQVKQWSDKTVSEWKEKTDEGVDKAVKLTDNAKKETKKMVDDAADEVEAKTSYHSSKNLN